MRSFKLRSNLSLFLVWWGRGVQAHMIGGMALAKKGNSDATGTKLHGSADYTWLGASPPDTRQIDELYDLTAYPPFDRSIYILAYLLTGFLPLPLLIWLGSTAGHRLHKP